MLVGQKEEKWGSAEENVNEEGNARKLEKEKDIRSENVRDRKRSGEDQKGQQDQNRKIKIQGNLASQFLMSIGDFVINNVYTKTLDI